MRGNEKIKNDKWVKTVCTGCYGQCAIRVHVVDGIAVKVEGDPDSVLGPQGGVCGKSSAALQLLYHPKRFNYPLKRTNPEKGIGIDPKWKRISWDEALEDITERLKKIHADNPGKFVMSSGPGSFPQLNAFVMNLFCGTFGGDRGMHGMGLHCGNASHLVSGMNHASWDVIPDFDYCNYTIQFGSNMGGGTGHSSGIAMLKAARARERGMKAVVFDPMCNFYSGQAREWIPIKPATDIAVALSMVNVIANDLKIYDAEYLRRLTNACYLIQPNGEYARSDDEPMIWDNADSTAKKWNDSSLKDEVLEGTFDVNGVKCKTAFSLIKDHVRQYTPEWAEEISTVPAGTIRRIATEFANAASVGSTIEIKGVTLPYRPAAVVQFRGAEGHTNGFHTFMAIDMINQLVGSSEVPGGTIGWAVRSMGYPETGNPHFSPYISKDGFIASSAWTAGLPGVWPHAEPQKPKRAHLRECFTAVTSAAAGLVREAEETWEKFNVPPYEMSFVQYCNPLMTGANTQVQEERMKKMFIVALAVVPNETTEAVADIILPDVSPLELTDAIEADNCYHFNFPMGMLDWEFHPHIAVVEPTHERRFIGEVYLDLLNRLGMKQEANQIIVKMLGIVGDPPPLEPDEDLTSWEDLSNRLLKTRFGEAHDLSWFKQHGFISWTKKVEEVYWRPHVKARSSIYNEWLIEYKEKVRAICDPVGFSIDWEQFTPPVTYFPSVINKTADDEFDMISFGYRDILHNASGTQEMPWLLEVSERNPFTFNACMNKKTAEEKGIRDKDMIYIENRIGQRIKTRVHIMEGIHPEAIAMTHGSGHFLDGHPAKGKGGLLNAILEVDWDHFDPVCQNIETAARVKLYRAED